MTMIPTILLNDRERIGIRTNDTAAKCSTCGEKLEAGQGVRKQINIRGAWRNRGFLGVKCCAREAIVHSSESYWIGPKEVTNETVAFVQPCNFGGKNVRKGNTIAALLAKAVQS